MTGTAAPVIPSVEPRTTTLVGWRAGKPEEDPEKMKKLVIVPFVEKRFVEVALVVVLFPITAFDAVRLVTVAVRAFRSVAKRFDDEALVRVAKVEKRLVFVAFVISLFTPAMFVA